MPFRARGTHTMKLWSFDARSKGQPWPLPCVEMMENPRYVGERGT